MGRERAFPPYLIFVEQEISNSQSRTSQFIPASPSQFAEAVQSEGEGNNGEANNDASPQIHTKYQFTVYSDCDERQPDQDT